MLYVINIFHTAINKIKTNYIKYNIHHRIINNVLYIHITTPCNFYYFYYLRWLG